MKLHATGSRNTWPLFQYTHGRMRCQKSLESHRNREFCREVRHSIAGKHRIGGMQRVRFCGPEVCRRRSNRCNNSSVSDSCCFFSRKFEEVVYVVEEAAAINVVNEVSDHFFFLFFSFLWKRKMREIKGTKRFLSAFKVVFVWRMNECEWFEIGY